MPRLRLALAPALLAAALGGIAAVPDASGQVRKDKAKAETEAVLA